MSRSNGDKARSNVEKKRRTKQRVKDRAVRSTLKQDAPATAGATEQK